MKKKKKNKKKKSRGWGYRRDVPGRSVGFGYTEACGSRRREGMGRRVRRAIGDRSSVNGGGKGERNKKNRQEGCRRDCKPERP